MIFENKKNFFFSSNRNNEFLPFFTGLVTAAMKLKRKEIENRFCNQLDLMYSGTNSTNLNKITKDQPVKMSQIAPA